MFWLEADTFTSNSDCCLTAKSHCFFQNLLLANSVWDQVIFLWAKSCVEGLCTVHRIIKLLILGNTFKIIKFNVYAALRSPLKYNPVQELQKLFLKCLKIQISVLQVSFFPSSKISNVLKGLLTESSNSGLDNTCSMLTTHTGPPAGIKKCLSGKLQEEKPWESFFSHLINEVSTLTGELCAIFIPAVPSYLL